jgi:hypothetical protein
LVFVSTYTNPTDSTVNFSSLGTLEMQIQSKYLSHFLSQIQHNSLNHAYEKLTLPHQSELTKKSNDFIGRAFTFDTASHLTDSHHVKAKAI